jgi:hypothetical protein
MEVDPTTRVGDGRKRRKDLKKPWLLNLAIVIGEKAILMSGQK